MRSLAFDDQAEKSLCDLLESFGVAYNFKGTKFPSVAEIELHPEWTRKKIQPRGILKILPRLATFILKFVRNSSVPEVFTGDLLKLANTFGLEKALYKFVSKNPSWAKAVYASFTPAHLDAFLLSSCSFAEILIKDRKNFERTGFVRLLLEPYTKQTLETEERFIHSLYRQNLYSNSRAFFALLDICIASDISLAFDKKAFSAALGKKDFLLKALEVEPQLSQSFLGFTYLKKSLDLSDSEDCKLLSLALVKRDQKSKSKVGDSGINKSNFGYKGKNTVLIRALFLLTVFEKERLEKVSDARLIVLLSRYGLCQKSMNKNTFKGIRLKLLQKHSRG